jgi:hypothetical protein
VIAEAEGAGALDEHAADELRDRADKIFDAYQSGDAERIQKEIEEFGQKLGEAAEKDEVSVEAAAGIQSSLNELIRAIASDPPSVVEEPEEEDSSGDEESSGDEDHGHGNDNGNGKGNGNAHGHDDD